MTMYNNKLVASIRSSGKILRENGDTVYLPFGSEYSILLKNLNTVRAVVNIFIDGTNVTPNGLVINAGATIDFERSLANGSLVAGNKFKFIERTNAIEEHRGIKLEDGLIRIEYQFEVVTYPVIPPISYPTYYPRYPTDTYDWPMTTSALNNVVQGPTSICNMSLGSTVSMAAQAGSYSATADHHKGIGDAGITVPGSKSDQKFTTTTVGTLESTKHTIVLKIVGAVADKKVEIPVTVTTKIKCDACGTINKTTSKFCSECGSAVELFR